MSERVSKYLPLWMLAGIVLGLGCGYYLPQLSLALDFVGRLFLGGLKLLIIPLIVAGTITGLNALGDMRKAGRVSGRVLLYFLSTTAVAVVIGVVMVLVIGPGRGLGLGLSSSAASSLEWNSISDALAGLIPGNLVQAVSEGKYFGVVLLALFLGGVLSAMGARGRTVVTFFTGLHEGLIKLVMLLLYVAPIGLFSLIGSAVAGNQAFMANWSVLGSYALTALAALVIHGFLILPLILWLFARRSPFQFYGDLTPAFLTAAGTSTSLATFPVTCRCLLEKSKVDNRSTSMVLPLGSVINLDGTAISMVVATLFAAQIFGVAIGLPQIVLVTVLAVLLSFGAAGIPSAVLVTAPVLFGAVGLSIEHAAAAMVAVVAFDWLVDRVRAIVNLSGDAVGAAVVAESFELKTARRSARERKPLKPTRGRTSPTREPRTVKPDSRSRTRRPERPVGGPRQRARSTTAAGDTPSRSRPGRTRSPRQEKSPFQMKATDSPTLGVEETPTPAVPTPAASQPSTGTDPETKSRRRSTPRRTATNGDSPTGAERRSRPRRRPTPTVAQPDPVVEPNGSTPSPVQPIEADAPAADTGRLTPAVVARELAKVSAQLHEPDDADEADAAGAPVENDEPEKEAPAEMSPSEVEVSSEAGQFDGSEEAVDAGHPAPPEPLAGDTEPVAESAVDGDSIPDEVAIDAEPTEAPTSFGRTRIQRGAALKKAAAESPPPAAEPPETADTATEPEPEPEPASQDVSFGRVKRKRIRK